MTNFFQHRRGLRTCCGIACLVLAGCGSDLITEADKTETVVAKAKAEQAQAAKSATTEYSGDAFRRAAHEGKIETVQKAIDAGIDVNGVDPSGSYTALHMAAYNGHNHVVKLLLKQGATVDARDHEGKTPLIHASSGAFTETVETLIAAGADINAIDTGEGYTPLMTAAALGEKQVVEVLLKHNADKTITDADGDTAHSHAVNTGHPEIAELLK